MRRALLLALLCASLASAQPAEKLMERASALYGAGRFLQASVLYAKAEARGGEPLACSFNRGNALFQANRIPEAAAAYRRAVRASGGSFAPALFNLGATLYRLGAYAEAVAVYRRALALDPSNVSAWLYLSEACSRTGDLVGALRAAERAHRLDGDPSVVYRLAEIHVALGDVSAAIAVAEEGWRAHPEEPDFLVYVGDLARGDGRFDRAIDAYREALGALGDRPDVMYKLADVLAESGNVFLAMDQLSAILAVDSADAEAAIFLGNLALDARWYDRAERAYLAAARRNHPEAVYGFRELAREALLRRRTDEAKRLLETALRHYPGDAATASELRRLEEESP